MQQKPNVKRLVLMGALILVNLSLLQFGVTPLRAEETLVGKCKFCYDGGGDLVFCCELCPAPAPIECTCHSGAECVPQ